MILACTKIDCKGSLGCKGPIGWIMLLIAFKSVILLNLLSSSIFLISFFIKHRGSPWAGWVFYMLSLQLFFTSCSSTCNFPFVMGHWSCHTGLFDNHFRGRAVGMSAVALFINLEIWFLWSCFWIMGTVCDFFSITCVNTFPRSIYHITLNFLICCPLNFRNINLCAPYCYKGSKDPFPINLWVCQLHKFQLPCLPSVTTQLIYQTFWFIPDNLPIPINCV